MATLFGKNYLEAGKSSSPLLLRSNGEIKLLWGNKFIDLIKNGKLNILSKEIIQEIDNADSIEDTGIYLATEDNSIWVCINGTKKPISSADNSYISFLVNLELSNTLKNLALTNIGFYYDSLDSLNNANIEKGLVYVKDTNKLYVISNYSIQEYSLGITNKLDSLEVGNLTITSNMLKLTDIVTDNITCNDINAHNIKSYNYATDVGFSLGFDDTNKSVLNVDSINWRNLSSELDLNPLSKFKYTILDYYNIVTKFELFQLNDSSYVITANLKYSNRFSIKDTVAVEVYSEYNIYILTIDENDNASLNKSLPDKCTIKITLADGTTSNIETSTFSINKEIINATIVNDEGIEVSEVIIGNNNMIQINPIELNIINNTSNSFLFEVSDFLLYKDILNTTNCKVYKIHGNEFILSTRYMALRSYNNNTYTYHTILGTYNEKELGISDDTTTHFGLYSDSLIVKGISMDNALFSGKLPSYTGEVTEATDNDLPTMKIVNNAINNSIENLSNQLSNLALPIGTIVMWGKTKNSIPDGWAICDGNNETPNLIDKFIIGSDTNNSLDGTIQSIKVPTPIDDENTQEAISSISLDRYALIFIMKIK